MKFFKGITIILVLAIASNLMWLWYGSVITGSYLSTAPIFLGIISGIISPLLVVWGSYALIRLVIKLKPSDFNF